MKQFIIIFVLLFSVYACKNDKAVESKETKKEETHQEIKNGSVDENGIRTYNGKNYSPYVDDYKPTPLPDDEDRPLFGDTHLHTSWSTDAGMLGTTLGPDAAYRISRGEEIVSNLGWKVKLIRPLDFVVVSDHAENLGLADFIRRSDPILLSNKTGKKWHDMVNDGKGYDAFIEWARSDMEDLIKEPRMMQAVWAKVVENADKYNDPGNFTAFHGFEWTSMPNGNNMHRVVIFRDAADKTSKILPFSMYDSVDPEDLWNYLEKYEELTGGKVLAIPHNGNLSNGLMFDVETYTGKPLTKEYADTRMKWEPLVEVTQQKGDGEAHPFLSPDDAFADFETMDKGNVSGKIAKTEEMLYKEYAREALKTGLELEQELGTNPYKFGMIGSTDNHTALPTSREENNFSKTSFVEPSPERAEHYLIKGAKEELSLFEKDVGAAGLAAVWASENTREAIWDAMARKEVYATTGSRLVVRVFGGWDFSNSDLGNDFVTNGYKNGVPMGGDLSNSGGKVPSFIIKASKDPDGANLDRVQVIKGWLDVEGKKQEKVYDIAVSDNRVIENGKCSTDVGSTVDLSIPTYSNTIGAAQLNTLWIDPDFNENLNAFYYFRVIEIPTPRWTAYDVGFFEDAKMPENTEMVVQDRAYTSPIWYNSN